MNADRAYRHLLDNVRYARFYCFIRLKFKGYNK